MADNRERREEEAAALGNGHGALLRGAETLRNAAAARRGKATRSAGGISLFWRIFGGTLLSIVALVVITAYQQFTSTLNELRNNLDRLNEGRADLVKAEDFNARLATVWSNMKELQAGLKDVSALKERSALLEQQARAGQSETNVRVTALSDRLKELDAANTSLAALKERSALLEQQLKAADAERKDAVQELQKVRERLAVLEGRQAVPPAAAPGGK
jgi:hypothetical protein